MEATYNQGVRGELGAGVRPREAAQGRWAEHPSPAMGSAGQLRSPQPDGPQPNQSPSPLSWRGGLVPETDTLPVIKPWLSPVTAQWDSEVGHLVFGETEAQTGAQAHSQSGAEVRAQASCSQMHLWPEPAALLVEPAASGLCIRGRQPGFPGALRTQAGIWGRVPVLPWEPGLPLR